MFCTNTKTEVREQHNHHHSSDGSAGEAWEGARLLDGFNGLPQSLNQLETQGAADRKLNLFPGVQVALIKFQRENIFLLAPLISPPCLANK